MKRKIVQIDEAKCDGCGVCVPNCVEGALQIIDGKARLISDLFCDGLGACIGYCPQGAITIEEREAEPYNERKVMDYIVNGGQNVILAHLKHLQDHNEIKFLQEALDYLNENSIPIPDYIQAREPHHAGCPGSRNQELNKITSATEKTGKRDSQLSHWPIQLHLINPKASHFQNADVLLAADCCAFSYGDFHYDFLNGKKLAIACPKLDTGKEIYLNKLTTMIEEANINSLTVIIMEVPCCRGLLQLVQQALQLSGKSVLLKIVVISIGGEILMEDEL